MNSDDERVLAPRVHVTCRALAMSACAGSPRAGPCFAKRGVESGLEIGKNAAARRRPIPSSGLDALRLIVSEEVAATGAFDLEDGLVLLRSGMAGLARRTGRSVRTLQRQLSAAGLSSTAIARQIRLLMTIAALAMDLPLNVVAKWLGYSSAVTYRRFVHRTAGQSMRDLRPRVRNCAAFLTPRA